MEKTKNQEHTKANSGSSLGSMPNSKPAPGAIPLAPAPSSPTITGELSKASDNIGPEGTVTRWELSGNTENYRFRKIELAHVNYFDI